jgi:hypothetical protein
MKNILYYLAVIILVAVSCTEDKGTYDYVALNEVTISDVEEQYIALSEAPFSVTPMVEQKLVNDESVLEYLWYAYTNGNKPYSADTLAFTKNLDLESLMLEPREYELVFRVTDTSSGIYYDYRSKMSVKGFPDGLQVLSNNANNAQVSILRGLEEGLSDFEAYKLKNDGELAGENPVSIIGISRFMRSGKPMRIAILCNDDNLGTYVTGTSLKKTINVIDAFQNVAAPISVSGYLGNSEAYATGVFGDNKLYTTYQPGLFGDDCSFSNAFNDVSPNFKAVHGRGFILFNTTTTGFGEVDSWGLGIKAYPPSDDKETPFDRANTGLSPIYGKTVKEYAMGVFEDPADGKRYILGLRNTHAALKKEMAGEDLTNATIFEFFNGKQVLLYAFRNKIYTYDVIANKVLFTYEALDGVTIDCMKISYDDKKLFVGFGDGTNSANSGSVHIFNVDLDGEILGVHEAYDNKFGKVVDFYENY